MHTELPEETAISSGIILDAFEVFTSLTFTSYQFRPYTSSSPCDALVQLGNPANSAISLI